MRKSAQILAATLEEVVKRAKAGVSSKSLDEFAEKFILEKGEPQASKAITATQPHCVPHEMKLSFTEYQAKTIFSKKETSSQ